MIRVTPTNDLIPGRTAAAALLLLALCLPVRLDAGERPHRGQGCDTCHHAEDNLLIDPEAACKMCHGSGERGPAGFHRLDRSRCGRCHTIEIGGGSTTAVAREQSASAGQPGPAAPQCRVCHVGGARTPSGLSPGHVAAAPWYHARADEVLQQPISLSCAACHNRSAALPEELQGDWKPPRPHLGGSHPFGIRAASGGAGAFRIRRETDPRLALVDGRIECTTCHDLLSGTRWLLVETESPDQLCTGCHERVTPSVTPRDLVVSH